MIDWKVANERAANRELREFVTSFPRRCNHLSNIAIKRCRHLLFEAGVDLNSVAGYLLVKVTHKIRNFSDISELVLLRPETDIAWDTSHTTEFKKHENEVIKRLRSPNKGVSVHAAVRMWRARRKIGNTSKHLGYHATDLAASMCYLMASNSVTSRDIGAIRVLTNDPSVISTITKVIDLSGQRVLFKNGYKYQELGLTEVEKPGEFENRCEFSGLCTSSNSSIPDDIDLAIEWTFEDEILPSDILLLL